MKSREADPVRNPGKSTRAAAEDTDPAEADPSLTKNTRNTAEETTGPDPGTTSTIEDTEMTEETGPETDMRGKRDLIPERMVVPPRTLAG